MKKILIAGLGNIFQGDHAFGCEVVRRAYPRLSGPAVAITDFGTRGEDLACSLTDDHQLFILIDTLPRGGAPGTIYLVEPDLGARGRIPVTIPDSGCLDALSVIAAAQALGGIKGKLYVLGCEPEPANGQAGSVGLSPRVAAAAVEALHLIESLVKECLQGQPKPAARMAA